MGTQIKPLVSRGELVEVRFIQLEGWTPVEKWVTGKSLETVYYKMPISIELEGGIKARTGVENWRKKR